jgi:acetoin utilization deacetylase AcuC-like enzyme
VDLFYSDTFELPLPAGHRFPMAKYRRLRERVAESGLLERNRLLIPAAATREELERVHDPEYVRRVFDGELDEREIRRIGFPWSPRMVERSCRSAGASIAAARAALRDGIGINLAGGTHHAMPDSGAGYCVFNDVCVAARTVQAGGEGEPRVRNVLIVDLDVHQGNGTAAVARGDATLFAFSLHCNRNYPFRKTAGDLDIELEPGTGDEEYLGAVERGLDQILAVFQPDLAFYLAGADPWSGDRLGQFALSKEGLRQRDELVLERLSGRGIPVSIAMAGGYAPNVEDIVDIHLQTIVAADRQASRPALR